MKLDIGCGPNLKEGYVGLDIVDYGQQYVQDIRNGIPIGLGEPWEEIRAAHLIEHLSPDEAIAFLNDCWHKCELLYLVVPHKDKCERAWVLVHKSYYNEFTFRWLETEGITRQYNVLRWEIVKLKVNDVGHIHVWMKPVGDDTDWKSPFMTIEDIGNLLRNSDCRPLMQDYKVISGGAEMWDHYEHP